MKYFIASVFLGSLMLVPKGATMISSAGGCSITTHYTGHSVAVDNKNRVHTLWENIESESTTSLYYRRSLDGGETFGDTSLRIIDSLRWGEFPRVTILTNNKDAVYIFWIDTIINVNCKRSLDGGDSWEPAVTIGSGGIGITAVTSGDDKIYAAWLSSGAVIRYAYSGDTGASWDTPVTIDSAKKVYIDSANYYPPYPSIAVSGNFIHMVWNSSQDDSMGEIYYKRSVNDGVSWDAAARITNDTIFSIYPTVASWGNYAYMGWNQDSAYYFIRSSDNGENWSSPVCLIAEGECIDAPQVNARSSFVTVILVRNDSTGPKVELLFSEDYGVSWDSALISDSGNAFSSSAIDDSGYVHTVWTRLTSSGGPFCSAEVFYSKYSILTGVEENSKLKTENLKLNISQNPVFSSTMIRYSLPFAVDNLKLAVYDLSGRCVKMLFNGGKQAGSYSVNLDAKDLTNGVYFLKLNTDRCQKTRKLILMR